MPNKQRVHVIVLCSNALFFNKTSVYDKAHFATDRQSILLTELILVHQASMFYEFFYFGTNKRFAEMGLTDNRFLAMKISDVFSHRHWENWLPVDPFWHQRFYYDVSVPTRDLQEFQEIEKINIPKMEYTLQALAYKHPNRSNYMTKKMEQISDREDEVFFSGKFFDVLTKFKQTLISTEPLYLDQLRNSFKNTLTLEEFEISCLSAIKYHEYALHLNGFYTSDWTARLNLSYPEMNFKFHSLVNPIQLPLDTQATVNSWYAIFSLPLIGDNSVSLDTTVSRFHYYLKSSEQIDFTKFAGIHNIRRFFNRIVQEKHEHGMLLMVQMVYMYFHQRDNESTETKTDTDTDTDTDTEKWYLPNDLSSILYMLLLHRENADMFKDKYIKVFKFSPKTLQHTTKKMKSGGIQLAFYALFYLLISDYLRT